MAIITLTSDWGCKDHYLGAVKGKFLKLLPETIIIDISHNITPFNIEQAAFIIKNSYTNFPEGTIHIIAINTEESTTHPHTIVYIDEQYFIGADTGIFSLIFDKKPDKIIELDILQDSDYFTFSTRDRFVNAAVRLAKGEDLEKLGDLKDSINQKILFEPVTEKDVIKGIVTYIDSYENLFTNISENLFNQVGKGRQFSIYFRTNEVNKINKSYNDAPEGEIIAIFSSTGLLQIAINKGNASSLLGMSHKDPIRIEFKEE